ncbi:MAG: hypothetical protein ACFBSC_10120 [Microcoleaceae cyanobacterium]
MVSQKRTFATLFFTLLLITIVFWILRGLEILAFFPGMTLWILILLTISTGVLSQISR